MRIVSSTLILCLLLLGSASAAAQEGVEWMTDLEAAKAEARQSGRLVLVHFWTPGCSPCAALERDVFSQPQVALVMQQTYVPVKINALESRGVADTFGITRVPTDVIVTHEGQVINRSISPNSPMAYIAHLTEVASNHKNGPGSAYDAAVAQAPVKVPNEAYAQLNIPPGTANPTAASGATTAAVAAAPVTAAPAAIANPYAAAPAVQPVNQPLPSVATATGPVAAPATPPNAAAPPIGDRYAMNSSVASTPAMNPYAGVAGSQATPPTAAKQQIPVAPLPAAAAGGALAASTANPSSVRGTAPTPGVVQQVAPAAEQPQLPPGSPPLGFEGYCPVTMKRQWQWAQGDVRFGAIHRGRTYLFASQACRDEFLANPDAYSPVLSGMDPVLHLEQSQSVPGKRQYALEYKGQFYLFSNEQTLNRFWQNADQYAAGVQQAMQAGQGRLLR